MGFNPETLGPVGGVIGSGLGIFQASQQNKAINNSISSVNGAAGVEMNQVNQSAELEKLKRLNASHAIRGRLMVVAAENGVGTGGTVAALERNAKYDAAFDNRITAVNAEQRNAYIASEASARVAQLTANRANPMLAAFSGGMSGLSAGLNIGGSLYDLENPAPKDDPARYARGGDVPRGDQY